MFHAIKDIKGGGAIKLDVTFDGGLPRNTGSFAQVGEGTKPKEFTRWT